MKIKPSDIIAGEGPSLDGTYWIQFKPGWATRSYPGEHRLVAKGKRAAHRQLSDVKACVCKTCIDALKPTTSKPTSGCTCQYGGLCKIHPMCPWCKNYTTVFASGHREFRCIRCKKVFDRKTTVNSSANNGHSGEVNIMKKTNKKSAAIVAKKSAKKTAAAERTTRESKLEYTFLKTPADEPTEGTTFGCVYSAIKKIKRGSLQDVTDAAIKCGLQKASSQDPRTMARIFLRQLANDGAVRVERNGEESAPRKSAKKADKKGAAKKGSKKSFKLVKK